MGNNNLRRLLKQESKWTDKSATRHKHHFNKDVYIVLEKDSVTLHYKAVGCKYCSSFVNAIFTKELITDLPIIHLYSPHKSLGFKDSLERK